MKCLTSWAVVCSVLSQLSQTVKVPLTVVTSEDGVIIRVIVMISVVTVTVLLLFSILSTGPMAVFGLNLSVRCTDF